MCNGVGDLLPLEGGNSMVRLQWQKVPDPFPRTIL